MSEEQPSNTVLSQQGLYLKYTIGHTDGHPVDPDALYFVLRYDEDTAWGRIGRETLWAMCKRIEKEAPTLVADIRERIKQIGLWRVFTNDMDTFVAMDWDDLPDVYLMHYGETMFAMDEDIENWKETPSESTLKIRVDEDDYKPDDPSYPPGATVEHRDGIVILTARVGDWAKANGRGFLCSTEW